jgi:hypothetical protein
MCAVVRRESIGDMFEFSLPTPSAIDKQQLLADLRALRELALAAGDNGGAAELETEIETSIHAYVGAAVTEIATLRAELDAPLQG